MCGIRPGRRPKSPRAPRTRIDKGAEFRPFPTSSVQDTQRKSPDRFRPPRRRRRNRPGNAQADGPLGDDALESDSRLGRRGSTDGGNRDLSREISQVTGQRGRRLGRPRASRREHGESPANLVGGPCQHPKSCKRRFTPFMSNSARAWRRSRATTCRSNIDRASSPSICTPALERVCSTSRIWGRPTSMGPTTKRQRGRWRRSAPPTSSASRPGASATANCSTPRAALSTISWSRVRPARTVASPSSSTRRARQSISPC